MSFQIGDKVWIARAGMRSVNKQCPHCLGKRFVTVLFGDGELATIDCALCSQGYEGSKGFIEDYEYQATAEQIQVDGVESERLRDGTQYRYRYNWSDLGGNSVDGKDVFGTEAEALAKSGTLAEEHHKEVAHRLAFLKEEAKKSWAWNASYHRRELKEAKRKTEYHTAKLAVALTHQKTEKQTDKQQN